MSAFPCALALMLTLLLAATCQQAAAAARLDSRAGRSLLTGGTTCPTCPVAGSFPFTSPPGNPVTECVCVTTDNVSGKCRPGACQCNGNVKGAICNPPLKPCKYEPSSLPGCFTCEGVRFYVSQVNGLVTIQYASNAEPAPCAAGSLIPAGVISNVVFKGSTDSCFYGAATSGYTPYSNCNNGCHSAGLSHTSFCLNPCPCNYKPMASGSPSPSYPSCDEYVTLPKFTGCQLPEGGAYPTRVEVTPSNYPPNYPSHYRPYDPATGKIKFTKCGTYTVKTYYANCKGEGYAQYTIDVKDTPVISGGNLNNLYDVCPGTVFTLPTATSKCAGNTPTLTVSVTAPDGTVTTCTGPTLTVDKCGTYTVTVTATTCQSAYKTYTIVVNEIVEGPTTDCPFGTTYTIKCKKANGEWVTQTKTATVTTTLLDSANNPVTKYTPVCLNKVCGFKRVASTPTTCEPYKEVKKICKSCP